MGQMKSMLDRKKTPDELRDRLELLRNDISITQRDILATKRTYKRAINILRVSYVFIAILYIIFLYTFYKCKGLSQEWWYALIFVLPLIILLIAVYFGVIKYYKSVIKECIHKLNKSKVDTEEILEEVRTTETYAVAKNILDEYSSDNTVSRPSTSN